MTKSELRRKLISTKCFIDNEFLNLYIELILNNINTKKEKFITESHHILQKAFFKEQGIKDKSIINDKSNLVNLTYKDHILAHYYLYNCSLNDTIKLANLIALINMTNEKNHIEDINELISRLDLYDAMRMEWKLHLSKKLKGTKNPKVSKWLKEHHFDCSGENNSRAKDVFVYDLKTKNLIKQYGTQGIASKELGISNIKERINKSKFGVYIVEDKVISKKFPLDEEALRKEQTYRENLKLKVRSERVFQCRVCGKQYIKKLNDLDYELYLKEYNQGHGCCNTCNKDGSFFRNKLKSESHKMKISESAKGRHWINNGIIQKQVHDDVLQKYLNDGWVFGQLKVTRNRSKE